ncbi:hypothetical protein NDU88_002292 [Pleurodeles waltl]|uniref:Uncharacterized protein n=1 Tax=Pleurodeles waltl TaxID=8319 RepID=A0AAV7TLJ6_PLEWA|nr:hypothetical protein NDU88_002292 [Pleurodeles waltl]
MESFVSMVVQLAWPTALMVQEIADTSREDRVIGKAKETLANRQRKLFLDGARSLDPEERKAMQLVWRRLQTNLKASESRRVRQPYLRVEEWVILKDRHPGWKFRTPFEPDVWVEEKFEGTMITARRNGQHVTRNMSWFRRVVVPDSGADIWPQEGSEEDAKGEDAQAECPAEARQHERPSTSPERVGPSRPERGDEMARVLPERCERYNLRPNPVPSQRL